MKNNLTFKVTEGDNAHTVTFHESKGLGFPFHLNLAEADAAKIHEAHLQIMGFEKDILNWMSGSDERAKLFLNDPMKALEESQIAIPKEVLQSIRNASDLLVNQLKK